MTKLKCERGTVLALRHLDLKCHSDLGIRVSSGADELGISASRAQDESMLLPKGDL
jgi:hypothetical protein